MKRLNQSYVYILAALLAVGVLFASCGSGDDWIRGNADFRVEARTANNGSFSYSQSIYNQVFKDSNDESINPSRIENWRISDNWAEITNLHIYGNGGADLLWFDIEVPGVGIYEYNGRIIPLDGNIVTDLNVIEDSSYREFMVRILERIMNQGGVTVIVRGETNIINSYEPIYFDFFNDMQYLIR